MYLKQKRNGGDEEERNSGDDEERNSGDKVEKNGGDEVDTETTWRWLTDGRGRQVGEERRDSVGSS